MKYIDCKLAEKEGETANQQELNKSELLSRLRFLEANVDFICLHSQNEMTNKKNNKKKCSKFVQAI